MVSDPRRNGETHITSARVRKAIQSIREIVGDYTDAEIYDVLRETNMDPNETAQKLLNQDPFHEVKRKKDKKNENTGFTAFTESRNHSEHAAQWKRSHTPWNRNIRRGFFPRNSHTGINREFRVVRDHRVNFNADHGTKPALTQHPNSASEQMVLEKSSSGNIIDTKDASGNSKRQIPSPNSNNLGHSQGTDSVASHKPLLVEEKRAMVSNLSLLGKKEDRQNSLQASASPASNNYVVGVYSSSSDPVHVPSPNSRSAGKVGAIRREVGVVGGRRKPSEHSTTHSSVPNSSFSVSNSKDISAPIVSIEHSVSSKSSQFGASVSEPIATAVSSSRPSSGYHYSIKQHQQSLSHQKALQHNMEWKPKSSQKHGVIGPQSTGTTAVNLSSDADNTVAAKVDETFLSQRLSQVNIENVIIPQHFRVSETERSQLTFGSFGAGFDSMNSPSSFHAYGNGEYSNHESCTSVPVSVPESSVEDASSGDQAYSQDGQTRASQSGSPAPASPLEPQSSEKIDSSSPQSMEEYANIGLAQSDSPSYSPSELQQLQNPAFLPSFSVNDPQTSNDMVFFRMPMDENMRIQGLSSVSETLSSQPFTDTGASSSVAMVQQQQMAQPYPQLHISHYPNLMQYRQFISPVFVPPMAALHNYSGNPAYPHPSNASSYVLMPPGGNSHLPAGIKYGTSQYKPVAAPSPTGYGNYTSPAGYAISAPGAVGAATGLDDVTRMKYKDNSLYVPNPQVETSEIWLQNPRDIQSMQTTPYYNIPGQAPHPAYMPTHAGHPSFNAAVPQSSHMQFPGGYHPQQPAAIANPHSLVHQQVPGMVGNVGMGVAGPAAAQVGAAFQPSSQLGHLSWTGNF